MPRLGVPDDVRRSCLTRAAKVNENNDVIHPSLFQLVKKHSIQLFFLPQTNEVIKHERVLAMKKLQSNKPAGLVRRGSGGQRLNREELFAALNRINTGAGQSERSSRSGYAHSHWNNQ